MNLNTKKAKKDLGNLIFHIAQSRATAERHSVLSKSSELQKAWGYYNFCDVKVMVIRLKEEFDIDYYLPEDVQELINEKQSVKEDAQQAFKEWQYLEEQEKAKAAA